MRVLVQRALSASVSISGTVVGSIGQGVLLFAGFTRGDSATTAQELARKAINLRIFPDGHGRLQHAINDVQGEVLAVPQFTLYGSTSRGRRPDFIEALEPEQASQLFDVFVSALGEELNSPVATGRFGADMEVALVNDGPFTLMLAREPS